MELHAIAGQSKKAAIQLAAMSSKIKNNALKQIGSTLTKQAGKIIQENEKDLEQARQDHLDPPLLKRLKFDKEKIDEVVKGIESLILLDDPVGKILSATLLDESLELYKVSRPIGVIGVIFESRPDALVQIAALCLKSGNAVFLKGGSEAACTNRILANLIHETGVAEGLPEGWLALLETRDEVTQMLELNQYIDLIIPRGSNAFVKYIMDNTVIPVLGHADGICHVYVDRQADLKMAKEICVDSKCQYVAVCNAAETFLVHESIAGDFLPVLKKSLDEQSVQIFGCKKTCEWITADPASEEDWKTEYLDYKVSIKVVDSMAAALDHINQYGSGHTDVIVTDNKDKAVEFMDKADTADAFWNCSSRFSDGFRFGLGAEVGISTNKIHARGPVGLEGLMIYQWRMMGTGQKVSDYSGPDAREFVHRPLNQDFK